MYAFIYFCIYLFMLYWIHTYLTIIYCNLKLYLRKNEDITLNL